MRALFVRVFPLVAFLGTALGLVVGGQQVNVSLLSVPLMFVIALITSQLGALPLARFKPLGLFVLATLPGTLLYAAHGAPLGVPLLQYGGILVCWIVVIRLFRHAGNDPMRIFDMYLLCATVSASVGVVQQIGYLLRITPLYDLHWLFFGAAKLDYAGPFVRVGSVFTEPSYFAAFLTPALYLSILRLSGHSRVLGVGRSLLFILALLCSFSTIGYIGLVLCIAVALRLTWRNVALGATLIAALGGIAMTNPAISSRLLSIPNALQSDLQGDENLSALTNGVNLSIATSMLSDRPVAGTGLGAYRVYSNDYLDDFLAGNEMLIQRINSMLDQLTLADGGSMYLRLPTELGLGGCLLLAWLVRRHLRPPPTQLHRDLANAALMFILVFSIRSGQLVRFEVIFFCCFYALIRMQLPALIHLCTPQSTPKGVLS